MLETHIQLKTLQQVHDDCDRMSYPPFLVHHSARKYGGFTGKYNFSKGLRAPTYNWIIGE